MDSERPEAESAGAEHLPSDAAAPAGPAKEGAALDAPRLDSVAAQIKRQLRDQGTEPEDKNFDFQMTLRGGGNELSDNAQEFADEAGADYSPPEFQAAGWNDGQPTTSGAMKWIVLGLIPLLLAAGAIYGLPAFKEYQMRQEQAKLDAELAERPPLEAVQLDAAFYAELEQALSGVELAWKGAGKSAYVYRYSLHETLNAGVSQELKITATVGGKSAYEAVEAKQAALDELQSWKLGVEAHPGVTALVEFIAANAAGEPLSDEKYIRYGYDYGREHMSQLQPVIDALAGRSTYDRVLNSNITDPPLKTSGGFVFSARGFGYLPVYKTDSAGHILMGSGSTLNAMTPQEVSHYYLFLFLNDATTGMDFYGAEAPEYYKNKIAPLPYDTGGERLKNVPLKPDGKPDGIACVVKDGKLLADGER